MKLKPAYFHLPYTLKNVFFWKAAFLSAKWWQVITFWKREQPKILMRKSKKLLHHTLVIFWYSSTHIQYSSHQSTGKWCLFSLRQGKGYSKASINPLGLIISFFFLQYFLLQSKILMKISNNINNSNGIFFLV